MDKVNPLVEYFTDQTPIVVISVLGLVVAGLALSFGIYIIYHSSKKRE